MTEYPFKIGHAAPDHLMGRVGEMNSAGCPETSEGWACCRPRNHQMPHVADTGPGTPILEVWTDFSPGRADVPKPEANPDHARVGDLIENLAGTSVVRSGAVGVVIHSRSNGHAVAHYDGAVIGQSIDIDRIPGQYKIVRRYEVSPDALGNPTYVGEG